MVDSRIPRYFDQLLAAYEDGKIGRCVHLGYWESSQSDMAESAQDFLEAQRRLDRCLLDMADLRDGLRILDVGCGFGGLLQMIDSLIGGSILTGVNIDPRQLEVCDQLEPAGDNSYAWKRADATNLPFEDNSMDRIFCVEAMFHFPSRADFLAEVASILKPGGLLVVSDILPAAGSTRADIPGVTVDAALDREYGPWPDFWCDGGRPDELAVAGGLELLEYRDVTAQTSRSYQYTAPEQNGAVAGREQPNTGSGQMLKYLHLGGHLNYDLMAFRKPTGISL